MGLVMRNDDNNGSNFGRLDKDILGLVFAYLPTQELDHYGKVCMWWGDAVTKFEKKNENTFKDRFPKIHAKIARSQHAVKGWHQELHWITKLANYFPDVIDDFKYDHFKEKIPNWEACFNERMKGMNDSAWFPSLFTGIPQDIFHAFAESNLEKLINIVFLNRWKTLKDFFENYPYGFELLSPNRPNNSEAIRGQIWKWIGPNLSREERPIWAIRTYQAIETLMKDFININRLFINHSEDLSTMLHHAAITGQTDIVKLLLKKGADVDAKNPHNGTPLHLACLYGHFEIAELLINQGADLNAWYGHPSFVGDYGSPLDCACLSNHFEVVKVLIKHGAKVHDDKRVENPLHTACNSGDLEVVKYLLENGINVNDRGDFLDYPLRWASEINNLELVKLLIDHGADVNSKSEIHSTPLIEACTRGHLDVAEFLVAHGAEIFDFNPFEPNPCDSNICSNEGIRFLLKNSIKKMFLENNPKHREYQKRLVENYSSKIIPICKEDPDLLLLCAIVTFQPVNEIERIIAAGAYLFGTDKYVPNPIELANKFHLQAEQLIKSLLSQFVDTQEQELSTQFTEFGPFSASLFGNAYRDSSNPDPDLLDIADESAGDDNPNEKKRPRAG
jgi:ankyrin repeat protein